MTDAFLQEGSSATFFFPVPQTGTPPSKRMHALPDRTKQFHHDYSGTAPGAFWVTISDLRGASFEFTYGDPQASVVADDRAADKQWSAVEARLDLLASLSDGWNGSLSAAAARKAKDGAKRFLASIAFVSVAPKAQLSASGELGFFWRWSEGIVEVNFDAEGDIEVMRLSTAFRMESYQQTRDIGEAISWTLQSIAVLADRRAK